MYLVLCKRAKLDIKEIEEYMTVGMCLDYIDEYFESMNPKKTKKVRKASQSDFDSF